MLAAVGEGRRRAQVRALAAGCSRAEDLALCGCAAATVE